MNEEEKYELFDGYLQDELSVAARTDFENQLSADNKLKEEFELFKAISGHLEQQFADASEREALSATLKGLSDQSMQQQETKVIRFKPWKYAVAASVLLLAGLFVFNEFSNPAYEDFASIQSISLVERGETNVALAQAEKAFNAQEYEQAVSYFDQVLAADADNTEVRLFKGIALLQLDRYVEAETIFEAIANGNSALMHEAQWQWALSKLKQEDYEACEELLKKVPEDTPFHEKAKKLLRKL